MSKNYVARTGSVSCDFEQGRMLKVVPTQNRIATVLACVLVCLTSAASLGCKSSRPSPEQAAAHTSEETAHATDKLRQSIIKEVAETGRREQMLQLVDQIDSVQTDFNKNVATFVAKYQSVNADYNGSRATFDQMFSDFDADRTKARSRILDLHFQLSSLATEKEWGALAEAETKMYEGIGEARIAEEEPK